MKKAMYREIRDGKNNPVLDTFQRICVCINAETVQV